MTDMTELDNTGLDQQLNRQAELDPRSFVTLVYRGDNRFMRFLAQGLESKGIPTIVREVPAERFEQYAHSVKQYPQDLSREEALARQREEVTTLVGPMQGVVVSDITFSNVFNHSLNMGDKPYDHPGINAYDLLDWEDAGEQGVVGALEPVFEQITAAHKKPVVVEDKLGDHIRLTGETGLSMADEQAKNRELYSQIIQRNFDIPVITNDSFVKSSPRQKFGSYQTLGLDPDDPELDPATAALARLRAKRAQEEGTGEVARKTEKPAAIVGLDKMGISPEDVVLLIDHHLKLAWEREHVDTKALSASGVELVLICPCCLKINAPRPMGMNNGHTTDPSYEELGFKFFPLNLPEPGDQIVDRLLGIVEEKRQEIAEEPQLGVSTEPVSDTTEPVKGTGRFIDKLLARFGKK